MEEWVSGGVEEWVSGGVKEGVSGGVKEGVPQAKQKPPEDRPAASATTPFGMAMSAYFCIKSILVG